MMDHTVHAARASSLEWALVWVATAVLAWALLLALRYTVRPGESDPAHIKHRILVDDLDETVEARSR